MKNECYHVAEESSLRLLQRVVLQSVSYHFDPVLAGIGRWKSWRFGIRSLTKWLIADIF